MDAYWYLYHLVSLKAIFFKIQINESLHNLIHNYRSHSGILALASGILDLLMNFFPESFDHLPRDKGFFDGPKPILVQSNMLNPHDLGLLMHRNRRKNSRIKFGARQVCLFVLLLVWCVHIKYYAFNSCQNYC